MDRIDLRKIAKRREKVIEGFVFTPTPRAVISGKEYLLFNSNDYLGLRYEESLKQSEGTAVTRYGTGPGAVRFISGTLSIYCELEAEIASFHHRESAILYSSAFSANVGIIPSMVKGQSKESLVSGDTLVLSDELNHRSIIDGIRTSGIPKEQRKIYRHLDYADLKILLEENRGRYKRVLVITDGIFSMLGEEVKLAEITGLAQHFQDAYEEGILVIVDDSHGVGAYGKTGRGVEETAGVHADVLIGTFGKAFGSDGGYAVGNKVIIDYLRETSPTYIYSNPMPPSAAGAAQAACQFLISKKGQERLEILRRNITDFKILLEDRNITLANNSFHPIQPILIGDSRKTQKIAEVMFKKGIFVTPINYPVVPKNRDEIRVQINALHSHKDMEYFIDIFLSLL